MALPEEEQMDAVFKSSRTNVDPVSGNDVPPGSLPEEVRDDIPAQLSEGEYVVPADVLRFYGMKFFEDLRAEAKSELARMDAEGRIGGEPIAAKQGEDLTPEEIAELEAIGMAVGGYITGQPTQSTMADPYQQQQMMYQQSAPVAKGNTGFAQGGLEDGETDVTKPTYTAPDLLSQFGPGFSFTQPSQTPAVEYTTVTLYGPGGDMVTLTLPTQKALYDEYIDKGYTTEQVQVTTETSVGKDDDQPPAPTTPVTEFKISDIAKEDLEKTAKGLSTINSIATAIASTVGLPIAAIVNTASVAKYNDILDRMESEGIETDLKRKGSIFGGESGLFENLKDTDETKGASFGDTWLGDLLGFDGKAGVQGPGLKDSFGGARRTGDGGTTNNTTPSTTQSNKNKSSGSNSKVGTDAGDGMTWVKGENTNAVVRVRDDDPRAVSAKTDNVNAAANKAATQAQKDVSKTESIEQKISRGGGFKEGGLMKKTTKKKK